MSFIYSTTRKAFTTPTLSYLRDFILDNGLTETDSIGIAEKAFDELALDYRHTYMEPLPIPFSMLGVWVKVAAQRVGNFEAIITHDDPFPAEDQSNIPEKVYKCGYCGCLIDEHGQALSEQAYAIVTEKPKKTGNWSFPTSICNHCKEH